MRRLLYGLASLLLVSVLALSFIAHASADSFTRNNIMSDVVFDNVNSMSAAQIDNWLNSSFPSSCISTNNGFYSPDPIGYNPSQGYLYGGNVSGGQVIYDAAQAYGINPQVLIATLQKESSVVSGDASYHCNYINTAMGYGCPDSGSCPTNPATMSGFSKQVIHAAWLFKFGEQRSEGNTGWAVIKGNWNNSDDPGTCYGGPMTQGTLSRGCGQAATYFDGYTTIDGTSVHMDNGTTASLYWYTPHFSGNQNFFNIFTNWFGSTYTTTPYAWAYVTQQYYSDAGHTQVLTNPGTVAPGSNIYAQVQARNIGTQTWTPSVVHLGTSHPLDRSSPFYDASWLGANRPAALAESSVAPGQIGTFNFILHGPVTTGTYYEYFNLLAEGVTWMNDPGLYYTVNVVSPVSARNSSNTGLASGASISANQFLLSPDAQTVLTLQNDGNLVEYTNYSPAWYTNTVGQSANRLSMQSDGNLVLYNASNQPLWASGTDGNPGAHLTLQTDGNIVIYSAANAPLWATYTTNNPSHLAFVNSSMMNAKMYPGQRIETANRKYTLIMQTDGNLVLYSPTRALWATGTNGKSVAFLSMQGDGNLVLYDSSYHPLWYSRTDGRGSSNLVVQADGNLVIYSSRGPTWTTNTVGQQ